MRFTKYDNLMLKLEMLRDALQDKRNEVGNFIPKGFTEEHMDGIIDGLSIALELLEEYTGIKDE